jgi:hypothetical protein
MPDDLVLNPVFSVVNLVLMIGIRAYRCNPWLKMAEGLKGDPELVSW